jgi:hypothetical protein
VWAVLVLRVCRRDMVVPLFDCRTACSLFGAGPCCGRGNLSSSSSSSGLRTPHTIGFPPFHSHSREALTGQCPSMETPIDLSITSMPQPMK